MLNGNEKDCIQFYSMSTSYSEYITVKMSTTPIEGYKEVNVGVLFHGMHLPYMEDILVKKFMDIVNIYPRHSGKQDEKDIIYYKATWESYYIGGAGLGNVTFVNGKYERKPERFLELEASKIADFIMRRNFYPTLSEPKYSYFNLVI